MVLTNHRFVEVLALTVLLAVAAYARPPVENGPTCGYESCPKTKEGVLNIHLVPHTHDDVGWLKTVDQYYYGSRSMTQKAGVQYIIDSVVDQLLHDPNKRFIYVETAFLWKWWKKQHDVRRHQVKKLIQTGRLEIIGGAWSMNDEAVTNYMSIIDQFTWGFRKLNDTFGTCARPRVGWQIDPFGHSREMASLFAQMGFDGMFLGRLDYQDKVNRLGNKNGEMIWEASANLGKQADLFTGVLFNTYSPPPGFCFDVLCADEPVIDDKHSPDYNLDNKVKDFISYAFTQAASYGTNNILMTMGEDFHYQAAQMWYTNLDKLIRHINDKEYNGTKVNIFYSTPSCYLKALHSANKTWNTKTDDFFPYASDPHSYWTGYYTSRPTIKYFERKGNNFLQVCKQLHALADLGPEDMTNIDVMREVMGVMQHHDAITGTEKQHVADDYARMLYEGFSECDFASAAALNKLMKKNAIRQLSRDYSSESESAPSIRDPDQLTFQSCLMLNQSQCEVTENNKNFVVTVYNPLSRKSSQFVRLPVPSTDYKVVCSMGHEQPIQFVPIPESVLHLPSRTMSSAMYELVFKAEHLPPLGYRSFYVSKTSKTVKVDPLPQDDPMAYNLGGKHFGINIDPSTNMLKNIRHGDDKINVTQNYFYYEGMTGNNEEFKNRSSGAYIFRPNGTDAYPVTSKPKIKTYKGDIVSEMHMIFNEWISQVVRIYAGENHAEVEWMVGPIPVDDKIGKEIVSRFITDFDTKGEFFTDSNGREMLQRKRDYRPTWKLELVENVSGNYYPITSKISIRDIVKKKSFAVLVDRAQGGSSLKDGQLELMVHRRLLKDDAFGVGEALNEEAYGTGLIARGQHYIVAGSEHPSLGHSLTAQQRMLAEKKLLDSWLFFTPVDNDMTFEKWQATYNMEFSGLKKSLPRNVHILTLEPWKGKSLLLRLEHFLEKNEDHELSKPVTVNVQDILNPFKILYIRETTLGGNQWLSESNRLQWNYDSNQIDPFTPTYLESNVDFNVDLRPMQIRTFVIDINN